MDSADGDELMRWQRRRGSPAVSTKTGSVEVLQSVRALGARPARCSRRRRSERTRWHSTGTMEGATTLAMQRQVRRPWCGRARKGGGGRVRCPRGRGGDVEPMQCPGARRGKLLAPWRARARRRQLSACLAGTKQLAGMGQHSAGPPGGPADGLRPGKFSPSLLISVFLFFCRFVALSKMARHF